MVELRVWIDGREVPSELFVLRPLHIELRADVQPFLDALNTVRTTLDELKEPQWPEYSWMATIALPHVPHAILEYWPFQTLARRTTTRHQRRNRARRR